MIPFGFLGSHGDPDAERYIAAANLTNAVHQNAARQLIAALKAASIWSKFRVIRPYIGGNATAHSYNMVNPTLNRATFSGAVTHDNTGITGDGATGYVDENLAANDAAFINSLAFGAYVRNSITSLVPVISAYDGANLIDIYPAYTDGNAYFDNCNPARISLSSAGGQIGLQTSSRTSSALHTAYQRGVSKGTSISAQGTLPTANFQCLRLGSDYSSWNIAFFFVSTGLNSSEVTALNSAVEACQTALSRNV